MSYIILDRYENFLKKMHNLISEELSYINSQRKNLSESYFSVGDVVRIKTWE